MTTTAITTHPRQITAPSDAREHPRRVRVLVSYFYLRNAPAFLATVRAMAAAGVEVLVDCGAFSDWQMARQAARKGKPYQLITVDEYSAWLATSGLAGEAWGYIALDVVKQAAETRANLARMTDGPYALRPMPVWVYGESTDALAQLVDVNPHVCVPGGVDAQRAFMVQRFQRAHRASGGRAQIHGLGFVRWPDMLRLPLASVDASSWNSGDRFGSIATFDPVGGLETTTFKQLWHDGARRTLKHMAACNVPGSELRDPARYRGTVCLPWLTTIAAHAAMARAAARRGLRYFFAAATVNQLTAAAVVSDMARGDGTFDAPKARARMLELRALYKTDPARAADCVAQHALSAQEGTH